MTPLVTRPNVQGAQPGQVEHRGLAGGRVDSLATLNSTMKKSALVLHGHPDRTSVHASPPHRPGRAGRGCLGRELRRDRGQAQAVFTALFAALALSERPGRARVAGMTIALAGIGVAAVDGGAGGPVLAFVLVVVAAACWGVSNVLTRRAAPPDALAFMVWVSTVPVLPLLGLSLLFEGWDRDMAALAALDWTGVAIILFIAWVGTVFGFGAWGFLLRHHPASSVAPFTLLVPVFGMSSAALFLGEAVSPLRWCAAVLLVGGVALTSLGGVRGRGARAPSAPASVRPTASQPPVAGPTASAPPAAADAPAPR